MEATNEHPILIDETGQPKPAPDFMTGEEVGRYLRLSETEAALSKRLAVMRQRLGLPHFRRGAPSNTDFVYPCRMVKEWALAQVKNGGDLGVS